MTVASLPGSLRCRRAPKISVILWAVSRHSPSSQPRSNSLWMGKFRLKMKLRQDGVEARQLYPLALLDGELGPEDQGPIVEPFANDVGAQSVGSGLECSDVVNRQKGIVIFAEADLRTIELPLDEVVAVEVICRLEGEEGCDTHHHGAENFIADIEVVVCEAAALAGEDAVVWILGGILRHADPEARPLFHTLEDEIDAIGVPLCHSA